VRVSQDGSVFLRCPAKLPTQENKMATQHFDQRNHGLTSWQKRQAATLYEFASVDHLKSYHRIVTALLDGVIDPLIETALSQNRDRFMTDARWGDRDTVANWSRHAWPFLKDLQTSLARDIVGRAFERYDITATNECLRGVEEFSMNWTTPDEEQVVQAAIRKVSDYASTIDYTLENYFGSGWNDYSLFLTFRQFCLQHPRIPKFRIRSDQTAAFGKMPPRTGVYIAQDDPNASLQFAWTGNSKGKLRKSNTFNEIGIAALEFVGRDGLWSNDSKMFDFAVKSTFKHLFSSTIFRHGEAYPEIAACAVAGEAFTERPCEWYFVELIEGEWEPVGPEPAHGQERETVLRVPGGGTCGQAGYYFTPAVPGSRRFFALGETTPDLQTQYGKTIWQWDIVQS
jgi:hypothetical protein